LVCWRYQRSQDHLLTQYLKRLDGKRVYIVNSARQSVFYIVIIVATVIGLAINFFGIDPIQALIFTAVFNGIAAVPLIWMIARIGNNKQIMGEHKNGMLANTFVWLTFVVMGLAVLALFYFLFTGKL